MICPHCGYDNYAGEEVCERCLHDLTQIDTTPRPKNQVHRSIIEDPVARLNPPEHTTVSLNDSVESVAETMKKRRAGCVIVEDNHRPVGVFTERDLLMKVAGKPIDRARTNIRTLMTAPVETVKASDTIAYVLNKMSIGGYRHLPIADDTGRVTGVISVRNILEYLAGRFS